MQSRRPTKFSIPVRLGHSHAERKGALTFLTVYAHSRNGAIRAAQLQDTTLAEMCGRRVRVTE